MKKKFSIVTIFGGMCLTIFLIIVLTLGGALYSVSAENDLQIHFVERTHAADKVVLQLQKTASLLETYRHGWNEESFDAYSDSCYALEEVIDNFSRYCADSDGAVNTLRRLRNFNTYQLALLSNKEGEAEMRYQMGTYAVQAFRLHLMEAQKMVQEDLILSSVEYEGQAKQIRSRVLLLLAIFALMVVVVMVLLLRIYLLTVRSIQNVDQHFQELSRGNWNIEDLHVDCWKEFLVLSDMINQMKHKILSYIQQVEAKAQLEAQLNEERLLNEKQKSMLVTARCGHR